MKDKNGLYPSDYKTGISNTLNEPNNFLPLFETKMTNEKYNDGSKPTQNEYLNKPTPLEALKEIEQYNFGGIKDFSKHIAIIESALKDYEELQNDYCKVVEERGKWQKETQKKLKAFEILKRYVDEISEYKGNEQSPYWICFGGFEGENGDLTKEEFDLLKEVLNYGK